MRCAHEEILDGLKCSLSVFSDDMFAVILCSVSQSQNVNHILHLIASQHMLFVCALFALMDLSVNSNSNHDPSQYDHSCRREMFYFSHIRVKTYF